MEITAGEKFQKLVAIMARLRAPGGCPWDREQTFDSIKPYTLEETYEVLDAIDRRDWTGLAEELGDFMLQAVFYAQMAAEQQLFGIEDALDAINQKLVRRHPHVFGEQSAETPRRRETHLGRGEGGREERQGPRAGRPAGRRAARAAGAGGSAADFVARRGRGVRLGERRAGARQASRRAGRVRTKRAAGPRSDELEDELGDLLFVLVNLARFVKVDPEQALRRTNAKFRRRFEYIERKLAERGRKLEDSNIGEMEALWQEAKR